MPFFDEESRHLSWAKLTCDDWSELTCAEWELLKCSFSCCGPSHWDFEPAYPDEEEPEWSQISEWSIQIDFKTSIECDGPSGIRQIGLATKGFLLTEESTLTLQLEGYIEHQSPGFDRGELHIVDCETEYPVASLADESDAYGGLCNMTSRSKSTNVTLPEGFYRIECLGDTIDELWHENAYWKFSVLGLTEENECDSDSSEVHIAASRLRTRRLSTDFSNVRARRIAPPR